MSFGQKYLKKRRINNHFSFHRYCQYVSTNFPFSIFNFLWAFGKPPGFPLYLCSLHFSPLKKIRLQIPFPVPESRYPKTLAKDAAAIPNAPCKKKSRSFYSTPLVETSPLWRLIKQKNLAWIQTRFFYKVIIL